MPRAKVNIKDNLENYKGFVVVAEQKFGEIMPITYELLGKARDLATIKNEVVEVIVLGSKLEKEVDKLAMFGAETVIYVDHPLLENYSTDAYTKIITDYLDERKPETVLVGATTLGRDLAPRIAARIGTGLTADCTKIEIDETDGKLLQTRPAFGGNLMATIICPKNRPQMATVRQGVMDKASKVEQKSEIEVIKPELSQGDIVAKVLKVVKETKKIVRLTDAEIIVAGGRGVDGSEGFSMLKELAVLLNGQVAGSRAAVDSGWIDHEYQVGQTGTTVRPTIYIACGISGAIQHIAGMQDSTYIIAINTNENAPINEIADYAVTGDLFEIVPELIKALSLRAV